MKEKIIGVILARGGSKGIKDKNLRVVLGRTLVGRCANTAVNSKLDEVFVYSDDQRIRHEAELAGATPVKRPGEVSGDKTTSEETVARFLADRAVASNVHVCLIQCTTPFLRTEHIDKAVDLFNDKRCGFDSVLSATPLDRFVGYGTHGRWVPVFPYRWLRQEHSSLYYMENGGLYLARHELWLAGRRMGRTCGIVSMGWWESMEIDEPEDLEVARWIAPMFLETEPCRSESEDAVSFSS